MDTVKSKAATPATGTYSPADNGVTEAEGVNLKPAVVQAPLPELRPRIEAGGLALTVLALIAVIFALQWAREFFIPLTFGILIAYTLNPLVTWLERLKLPRAIGATLVMLGLFGSSGLVATSVYNEAQAIVDELPLATYKLNSALNRMDDGKLGTLDKLRSAADALKKAASPTTDTTSDAAAAAAAATVKPPDFDLNEWLWAGSLGVAAFAGQLVMIMFLVFFALLSGDTFKRKLVRITGPSLSNKKITVQILDDINSSIQKYMFMLLVTNILVGLVTWAVLHAIGLDNPGAWAVAAGLLHIIPYFGPLITALITGSAAFLQFESFSMMLLVMATMATVASIVGMLVTTWMTGRIAKMNATAVFVALLFGGWLWGVWGMLLCVPIIVVVKVIAEHVEGMQAVAELLGE
ncbi:AI-2E family transporter [Candidimonas sp. SYP-B2681]|uniref:AI-2E family transporter n=1 Tax=Candidimonas sp. SYP-B2681 TaxID=2497686 RepID=UPI000F892067|nr:AI-2E family transporter [Candidimonas sp. SYP-B2681]RTZ47479.1 AI-2E family transporter [Candidimonas sp. SYP-B2681]